MACKWPKNMFIASYVITEYVYGLQMTKERVYSFLHDHRTRFWLVLWLQNMFTTFKWEQGEFVAWESLHWRVFMACVPCSVMCSSLWKQYFFTIRVYVTIQFPLPLKHIWEDTASATGWSRVQRNITECVCVIYKPQNEAVWSLFGLLRHRTELKLCQVTSFHINSNSLFILFYILWGTYGVIQQTTIK